MPSVTLQPSDETADIGLNSAAGTFTNEAAGGFTAIAGVGVQIQVTGITSATADSAVGTAACDATVEYTLNDGSSWVIITALTSSAGSLNGSPGGGDTDSKSSTETVTVGDIGNLSDIKVRAKGVNTYTGDGSGSVDSEITDWQITYGARVGIIGGE